MPFHHGLPVLTFLLVKFLFPLCLRFLAILANVAPFVAARAIAALDVVVELTLRFGRNLVAVNGGV